MFNKPTTKTPLPHNTRLSIETSTTTTTISPPSDDAIAHPPPLSPLRDEAHNTTQQELAFQISLQNLELQMISYQTHSSDSPNGASEQDIERVALAMENIANCHPNPKAKSYWKNKAKKFRRANSNKRDGVLKSVTKGFMIVLMTPFYILGATLWAIGTVFGRFGSSAFEGVGRLRKKVRYNDGNSLKSKPNAH
ncbi:hypothetical protein Agabi119p4_1584 [Agaricus bisporus var. burnettii]|uniref:Transmembrane protein n=1 Tax=Agaricus bisporus var. burnettii TaxID=192524 RepID=A0A8H7KJH3_AGABI|nr:hypothetical protein Agabi119p4_1584 [Agaricus bisporus var. burnettii]